MSFVKLDTGILDSTLWVSRDPREVFITALLMAMPQEFDSPIETYKVHSLEKADFVVSPGWYGFIAASGPGIVRRAGLPHEAGMQALESLGEPDKESRSSDWEGRRLVRVDGGYIVLNFMKYRDKDNTAAERMKRYRERKKEKESQHEETRNRRSVTRHQLPAEAEAEAEAEAKNTKKKEAKASSVASFDAPDWFPASQWSDFIKMRKAMKSVPFTEAACKGVIREVEKLCKQGHDAANLLETAVMNGWRTVYPPKVNGHAIAQTGESAWQRSQRERAAELAPRTARQGPTELKPVATVIDLETQHVLIGTGH